MMINNFKSRRGFFVKDSIRFRVTAILMALIMTEGITFLKKI